VSNSLLRSPPFPTPSLVEDRFARPAPAMGVELGQARKSGEPVLVLDWGAAMARLSKGRVGG